MPHRYSLRVENGALEGQSFPIEGDGFTVGRKSGSSLQLTDASVSGAHARLSVDDQGVSVRDLGSTNGTRIGSAKILEARLDIGQRVTFGTIHCTLARVDAEDHGSGGMDDIVLEGDSGDSEELTLEEPARPVPGSVPAQAPQVRVEPLPTPTPVPAPTLAPTESEEHTISAENLARAKKKSPVGALVLVVLAAGSAAGWWAMNRGGEESSGGRPVTPLAGNLLEDGFSFEGPSDWEALDEGEAAFGRSPRAAYSGELGLSVSLAAGESAVHASPWVDVRHSQQLMATARVRVSGAAHLRMGIELARGAQTQDPTPCASFGDAISESTAFSERTFSLTVPQGYDRARLLLAAAVGGSGEGEDADNAGRVSVDDASLVASAGGEPRAVFDEYRFFEAGRSLSLFKVDATLLSGMHLRPAGTTAQAALDLQLTEEANGVRLDPSGGEGAVLVWTAEPSALEGGLATMGVGGYALQQEDFAAEGVTDLVIGKGVNLLRVALGKPCNVRGLSKGGAFQMIVELSGGAMPLIQVRFQEERTAAINLAADAEGAERAGRLGECLNLWQQLLDRYPFEDHLVRRAESQRATLLRTGFEAVSSLEGQIERASFFRLAGLYRECRDHASEIATRYTGSEVEAGARSTVSRVDEDLAALETDLDRQEVRRLQSILQTLESRDAKGLAARMRTYLQEEYHVSPGSGENQ
ncbi:MAG TPA: FHA domain-containing protein [Planctomycetota bacterium]|nr:FHA domain-containing protein [Planctomycetota bacterium]